MSVVLSPGFHLSPIYQSIRDEENLLSDTDLWKIYESSPKVRHCFGRDEVRIKEKILDVFKRLINHLKDERSEGVVVYREGLRVYVSFLNAGKSEEELSDSEFYNSYLKSSLQDVLKKTPQLKNIKHHLVPFCPFENCEEFEIFKFDNISSQVGLPENIPCDFSLKVNEEIIPANSQVLIQKGGEVMSALVSFALAKNSSFHFLHLDHYYVNTVKMYKMFISVNEYQFVQEIEQSSFDDMCKLYELAKNLGCKRLQNYCSDYLALKAHPEHLFLLKDLLAKYKDETLQEIYDKLQPDDLMFQLESF